MKKPFTEMKRSFRIKYFTSGNLKLFIERICNNSPKLVYDFNE